MTGNSITRPARTDFAPEQVRLLRDTVAKDCSDAEFHYFLEIAATYDLDPLTGEVYAAKMGGNNGGAGRVVIMVGRNGWLKIANGHKDYMGIDGEVVRANDIFKVTRTVEGRAVEHTFEGSDEKRGEIVGAWAEVYRLQRPPMFFYAPASEYRPDNPNRYSPWANQPSVMMLKCAQVTALRLAFNIGGVYDEAEMARVENETPVEPVEETIYWGEDEGLAERLRLVIEEANRIVPGSYRPAKVAMKLTERMTDKERADFARTVEDFIMAKGGKVPDPPDEVTDAEVVGSPE